MAEPWYCVGCNAEYPTPELIACDRCGYFGRSSVPVSHPPVEFSEGTGP